MKFKNVELISKNGIDKKIESVDIDELTKEEYVMLRNLGLGDQLSHKTSMTLNEIEIKLDIFGKVSISQGFYILIN
ncbi:MULTISPECIES: hypothetical protein [Enterococcus]|uniref:hypothetical protein n=1 Tax=Enterococcus TaxID=1350 RepID=UPI000DBB65EE|nr:hypothetical protein [Enterococcus faecalis]MCU2259560.1 hypothetical protein [Enterococcus faecalis]MDJ9034696.1 hypothetical protein [Enterococcus faecalis]MDT2208620.1 hypothetical protein [Enterococcus faecalis]BBD24757.1 hypothetical protein KUB3006_C11830 [Enterococcus faecalis]BBD27798.1 hypothetical protein KUB3007_C11810 [Enterococcus faecalis]